MNALTRLTRGMGVPRAALRERMLPLRNPYSARRTNTPPAACRWQGRVPLRSLRVTRSVTLPGFRRLRSVFPSDARAARSEGFLRETIRLAPRSECAGANTAFLYGYRRLRSVRHKGVAARNRLKHRAHRGASRSHCATSRGTITALISSRRSWSIMLRGMRRDCEGHRR